MTNRHFHFLLIRQEFPSRSDAWGDSCFNSTWNKTTCTTSHLISVLLLCIIFEDGNKDKDKGKRRWVHVMEMRKQQRGSKVGRTKYDRWWEREGESRGEGWAPWAEGEVWSRGVNMINPLTTRFRDLLPLHIFGLSEAKLKLYLICHTSLKPSQTPFCRPGNPPHTDVWIEI